jgi:hypothetical protein
MKAIERNAARAAAPALRCDHEDVSVRPETVPWIRRMRTFRVQGGTEFPAGLLVAMPNGALTPPLVFAALPTWEQHWHAAALLRVEEIDPRTTEAPLLAEILRLALAGPGGKLATIGLARRELRDVPTYDLLSPSCQEPAAWVQDKRWYIRFSFIAPDGAVEGWQVAGAEQFVRQSECQLLHSSGSWPMKGREHVGR